jgi:hypothetical protein
MAAWAEQELLDDAVAALGQRLPSGWTVGQQPAERELPGGPSRWQALAERSDGIVQQLLLGPRGHDTPPSLLVGYPGREESLA